MRVIYNIDTKFVCELISKESDRVIPSTCRDIIVLGLHIDTVKDIYGLPKYKVVNIDEDDTDGDDIDDETGTVYDKDNIAPILDPLEYQVEPHLWTKYLVKLHDEVLETIQNTPSVDLKPIFENSPQYKKDLIYSVMEEYYASQASQIMINLSTEIYVRAAAEYFYIKEIEQREMTADERAAFTDLLMRIHNHNVAFNPMLSTAQWFSTYVENVLSQSDALRTQTLSARYYVTGRP